MGHIKNAVRQLNRRPGVSVVIIAIVAIGVGVTTGIFSVFHQVLIRPLPVPQPEELVNLAAPPALSYPMFRDLEAQQTVFSGLAAGVEIPLTLSYEDGASRSGTAVAVSGEYFEVLRLQPAVGRLIGSQDEAALDESRVAVLSYDYWHRALGGDSDVIGRILTVNGQALTIVGVAPAGFTGTTFGVRPQVFVPLTLWFLLSDTPRTSAQSRTFFSILGTFGRLQPDIGIEQAAAAIDGLHSAIIDEFEPNSPIQMSRTIVLEPGAKGQRARVAGPFTQPLTLLLGVTLLVLLIVCSNVANLLLARGTARGHEMAIRMAIGAGRGRLVLQVLAEASLLAFIGGIASLAIAKATLLVIVSFLPEALGSELAPELSSTAVLFAMLLSLSTVLLFGLAPAVQAARSDRQLTARRHASRSSTARGMTSLRNILTTSQIAFSLVLLVLAGLFAQSLANVSRLDLGIDVESVVTFSVSPARNGYDANRIVAAYESIDGALAAQPGVSSIASARIPLIAGGGWIRLVQGLDAGPDVNLPTARVNELSPGFFRTVGVPLLQGRDFTDADTADSADVAIVNESFARRFGLGDDVIGGRFRSGSPTEIEIVGLVADAASSGGSAKQEVGPQFYLSLDQIDPLSSQSRYFYVRSTDPESLAGAIPRIVAEVEPGLPVDNLRTMESQFKSDIYIDRLVTTLAGSFAILAALLAGVGLYGMLSYTVAQRTRELGLRLALGAIPEQLRGMIFKQVGMMTLVGCVVGIAAAIALGSAVEVLLFGISAVDPSAFVAAVVLLSVIALAASYIPARRASSVAPMEALRYE